MSSDTVASGASVANGTVPEVGIVVLNWESYGDTAECLESLTDVTYPNFEVFLVDNGSTDGSAERLQSEFEWCSFRKNDENLGFARGNNPGIEAALEAGMDYVLLLNNDTVVPPDFLGPLVKTAESDPDIVGVGGVQYQYKNGKILNSGGRFYTLLGGRVRTHTSVKRDEPFEVDYAPSSLLLIDSDFLEAIGLLHEGYFLGMEDVDIAVQARQRGKKIMIAPEATIRHKEGLTRDRSPFMIYHWMRNRLEFASARLPIAHRVVFYTMFALTILQFSLRWLTSRRQPLVRATVVGISDHLSDSEFKSYEWFDDL